MATIPKMKAKYGTFYDKLHKTSKQLSVQSLYVYLRNISRLRGLLHDTEDLPESGKWLLDKKLLAKFDALDLNKRRLMSVAAVKGLKAYGLTSEEWNDRLARASDAYDKQRKKRHITQKESGKWPKDGFKSLRTAAKDEKLLIKKVLKKPEKTQKDLIKIQNWIILFLYSFHPMRLDFADLNLEKPVKDKKENFLFKVPRKGWVLTLRKYKTAKFRGETEIKVARAPSRALSLFVPLVKSLTTHGKFLTNSTGGSLSRNGLSKLLTKLTKKHLGVGFSASLIRVLFSTANVKTIEDASKISNEMMHNLEQTLAYTRKDVKK
jgi:hypothetical protein